MEQESKGKDQEQAQAKQLHPTEELRKRAKDALEKANQVLRETGKPKEPGTANQGETTE